MLVGRDDVGQRVRHEVRECHKFGDAGGASSGDCDDLMRMIGQRAEAITVLFADIETGGHLGWIVR